MAKYKNTVFLKNSRGQSLVEYILLLAVLSSLGYSVYNGKRFKEFVKGDTGLFLAMRKGISYSYRYGREYNSEVNFEEKMNFNYKTNQHDTYFNQKEGNSRFFAGQAAYGSGN